MKRYLEKYPKQESDIGAMIFAYGEDKTNAICSEALDMNKSIGLIVNEEMPDFLDYQFI